MITLIFLYLEALMLVLASTFFWVPVAYYLSVQALVLSGACLIGGGGGTRKE